MAIGVVTNALFKLMVLLTPLFAACIGLIRAESTPPTRSPAR